MFWLRQKGDITIRRFMSEKKIWAGEPRERNPEPAMWSGFLHMAIWKRSFGLELVG